MADMQRPGARRLQRRLGLLAKDTLERLEPGVNLMRLTAPVQLLFTVTTIGFLLIARAFALLEERGAPAYR